VVNVEVHIFIGVKTAFKNYKSKPN